MRLIGIFVTSVLVLTGLTVQPAMAAEPDPHVNPEIPTTQLDDTHQVQSVQITTDQTKESSDVVKITATADVDISETQDNLSIINATTNETVQQCDTGTSCIYEYPASDYTDNQSFYARTANVSSSQVEVANQVPDVFLYSDSETVDSWEKYEIYAESEGTLPSGKNLVIVEDSTGEIVAECDYIANCTTLYLEMQSEDTSTFTGYIADGGERTNISGVAGIVAQTNTVTVSRTPWVLKLKSDNPMVEEGATFSLLATANQVVPDSHRIYIYDVTAQTFVSVTSDYCLGGLNEHSCQTDIKYDSSHQYQAYLAANADLDAESSAEELTDIRAVSNTTTVKRLPFVLNVTTESLVDDQVYYQGKLNQTLHYFSSAIVDNKTSKILEVCEYASECNAQGAGSTYGYPNEKFDVADGITYVVGRWSESGAGVTSEPAGYMYDIQASVSYKINSGGSAPSSASSKSLASPGIHTGGGSTSQVCAQTCVVDPINTVTGEFWLSETDADVQSLTPLTFTREYGTSKSAVKGTFGYGWNSNYDLNIKSANSTALNATSSVVLSQENGSTASFTKSSAGIWTTDVKTRATLQQANGKFIFTRDKETTFVFNAAGQLETISDLNSNTLTLTYSSGKLVTISNGKGQQLTISWGTNNLIASVTTTGGKTTQYAYTTGSDLSKVTYPDATSVTYAYSAHLITSFKDAKGGTTKNVYDDQKRVTQQTDTASKITTISYDIDKTLVTNPNGREDYHYFNNLNQVYHIEYDVAAESYDEYYEYDEAQNRTSTTYPDGSSVQTTYDASGNPLQVKDRSGNISTYTYNSLNRVLSETNPAGSTRTYEYNSNGNLVALIDFNGNRTVYAVNSDGTTSAVTASDGGVTSFNYTPQGLASQVTDPLNHSTQQTFNADGYLETATDELGLKTIYSYNSAGLVSSIKHPNGYSEAIEYDANGNVTKTTNRLGKTNTYTYDAMNRELTATDAAARVTKKVYDSMGNITRTTDATLKNTNYVYSSMGQLLEMTDARSKKTNYSYDSVGNLVTLTNAKGNETHYNYDANGNVVETINSNGIKVSTTYDSMQRPAKTVDAQRKTTSYSYDANSNLVSTILPNLAVETSVYNNMNQKLSFLDSDNGLKKWSYNKIGQPTSFTNTDNSVTGYTYDAAGNLKTEVRPDTSVATYDYQYNQLVKETFADAVNEYAYDANDNLVQEKQGTSVTQYVYDNVGNVTSRGPPTGAGVQYTYTPRNEVASITYPSSKSINYTYDNVGNLLTAANADTGSFSYVYDNTNNITTATNPNTTKQSYEYTNIDAVNKTIVKAGTTSLYEKAYGYSEKTGYLSSTETTIKNVPDALAETYAYDALSRISSVDSDQTTAGKYSYTNTGNLTNNLGNLQSFNQANQLVTTKDSTNSYDARGNRIAGTDTEYSYNEQNQLTSITKGSKQVDYSYDTNGLVKTKTVNSDKDDFVWDYQSSVPLLLSDGDYEYFYGPYNAPIAQREISTGTVTYLHADALGSVVSATSKTGVQIATYVYTAYGQLQSKGTTDPTHSKTRYGFAGEWLDSDTGLYNLRARWYEPSTGGFLSRDPLEQATNEAYSYASGNPLAFTDPLGLFTTIPTGYFDFTGSTGFGVMDELTFGLSTDYFNEKIPGVVDVCNPKFTVGKLGTLGVSMALPGGVPTKVSGKFVKLDSKILNTYKSSSGKFPGTPTPPSYGWPPIKAGKSNGPTSGKNFTPKTKDEVKAENPDNVCVFCRMEVSRAKYKTHVDHSQVKSKGGDATLENGQIACQHCNTSKNDGLYPKTAPQGFNSTWPNENWPPSWVKQNFNLP